MSPLPSPASVPAPPSRALAIGSPVYAIESVQSSRFSGDVVMLYEGRVAGVEAATLRVELLARHRYRYRPNAREGVDATDWFCAPEVRHCHSEVGFTDWGGRHARGAVVIFPEATVSSVSVGVVAAAQAALARSGSE